jgi:predicted acylesterase/phospholipase RssA
MLTHILNQQEYALAITPGFFRFYAEIGILKALEECNCLNPSNVTGSSAGALVGAFLASGTC